ncbi:phosphatase PAP2 family protein [Actinomycetaceae bacterium MB13-C1-2]|nr:phosphatase PAP2 family protein [Actinomycetaceae bacterium MB13-C1-2]
MENLKGKIGARWIFMIVVALTVLVASYLLLVRTYLGQYLENSALLGAQQVSTVEVDDALHNLHYISVGSLALLMVVYAIIGIVRKSWQVAFAAMGVLGASTVTTELLKKTILTRPDLAPIYENNAHNSFPSGHTTIAMAIVVSLLLILSFRIRGWIVIPATLWAVGIGFATVTARWHRFSDTLGADAVVLAIGAIAALWLLSRNEMTREPGGSPRIRPIILTFLGIFGVGTLAVGVILAIGTLNRWGVIEALSQANAAGQIPNLQFHLDPVFNENMFYAAQTLAYGFSSLSVVWFWATLHRIGTVRAPR